jgi:hypothetical protein
MRDIDKFTKYQQEIGYATGWAGLIGKPYHGGGGGVGEITGITLNVTVYHQEYDGATNYHDVPDALKVELARAVRRNFKTLLAEAQEAMQMEKKVLATRALEEQSKLMAEAGIGA